MILKEKQGFICTNKDTIINILKEANELIPQKLPLQKIIMRTIVIPLIQKLLDIVCKDDWSEIQRKFNLN